MAQQFQAPAALTENPGCVPSTMLDDVQPPVTPALGGSEAPFWPLCAPALMCTYIQTGTHIHIF